MRLRLLGLCLLLVTASAQKAGQCPSLLSTVEALGDSVELWVEALRALGADSPAAPATVPEGAC